MTNVRIEKFLIFFIDEILFIGTNEFLYMQILTFTNDEEVDVLEIEKENLKSFYYIFPVKRFFSKGLYFNKNNQKLIQNIQIDTLRQRIYVLFGIQKKNFN